MGPAEGFGAITHEDKQLGPDVGDLVVILGSEKHDLVFFDDALVALKSFDRSFSLEHEKGLRRHMIVHVVVIARLEVKDPGTKRL